jgi:hypothetical protein
MRKSLLFGAILLALPLFAQESKPSWKKCQSTSISGDEIQATRSASKEVRSPISRSALDIGKINVDIGVGYRGKLTRRRHSRSRSTTW